MGCSNTKSFGPGTGMESASPLTNAMNALNALDTSEVVEDGQKFLSQGQEKISQFIDEGQNIINQGQDKISQMMDEGEKIINQANEAFGK